MQRYHPASCSSTVNNNAIGGASARDTSRADSSPLPPNYSLNSRRGSQLGTYKLKCDKESLNTRLGPPDFYPQSVNCPEETLTREYAQSGYRETVEGLEEAREISLTQVQAFSKPVVLKCKESIRKCLRIINESRTQKRKAGQVYGVPLSNNLLIKPGVFPEQRPCGEEFRKKWIEGLSQPHKRLRSLADYIPHGYRKNSLFEVLIRNNVPILRANWFIKVTYLNQIRPSSTTISSGAPDKAQFSRTELWTKDVIDYLQYVLNEIISRNSSHSVHSRDRSPMLYAGPLQHRSDLVPAVLDVEEPSLHFKWWYMVRLVQWHHAEGLIFPSLIIDWVLSRLKEKELLEILQLVLPIIYGVLETVVLSQTYVRSLAGIAFRFIREPSPGGSDLVDNSRKAYTTSALIEMLRYLILSVPDTFVALDCFPLPPCLVSHPVNDGSFVSKGSDDAGKMKNGSSEMSSLLRGKGYDAHYQSLSFGQAVLTIQKCADNLAKAANPCHPGHNVAKSVQALDKALAQGDIRGAYKFLFEEYCAVAGDESWLAEASPCLRSSLKWIGSSSLPFVSSIFFLCEWATCDFRDFRTGSPYNLKFTGRKDFSQVYIAIRLLKLKMRELQNMPERRNENTLAKPFNQKHNCSGRSSKGNLCEYGNNPKNSINVFKSPGPLHDIVVCWIDQHDAQKGEGLNRLQLLIVELIRAGIFYPHAYVRQLIVSGIMDACGSAIDMERRKRHYKILKQLHGAFVRDAMEEARVIEAIKFSETITVYSNERRFVLHGLLYDQRKSTTSEGAVPPALADHQTTMQSSIPLSTKNAKSSAEIKEVKAAISVLLQLPKSSTYIETVSDESQKGVKRPGGSVFNKLDAGEGTPGCEECQRVKRQKISEERSSHVQGQSPVLSDDEDTWWTRKGLKSVEPFKVDPPIKSTKQTSRGRQKVVRKTQSLAQLAAARIEGSQGASTSHVCDSKVSCPHHRTGVDGENPKLTDGTRTTRFGDVVSIGKALKKLRFVDKRTIAVWLINIVRQLVEETEKGVAKVGQLNRVLSQDDKGSVRWKLSEDELSAILYLMDLSNDLVSTVKFLLWLLPKVLSIPSSTIHSGRSLLILQRNVENHACEVGEAFLLSSLRRYENILIAADLIPEALSATIHRASVILSSNGRLSSSGALVYARYLLKKYGSLNSVIEWEKDFKETCDRRLLSELESGRFLDGDLGFPLGVPAGVGDFDDFFRQKISGGRISRVGLSMRDVVQKHVEDAFHYFSSKDKKLAAAGTPKSLAIEKCDEGYQIAQKIIMGLMECIRQTGGAAQEGDPSLVSSAVSAIVSSVGPTIAKMPDFTSGGNYSKFSSTTGSLHIARCILRIHVTCLSLLKEALGERQSRVFEIALATETSSVFSGVVSHGKVSRSQFQSSPEAGDPNSNMSNEAQNNPVKVLLGKPTKITAAVSALVVGAVIHGVTTLERLVNVFKLKEGLDVMHFVRTLRSNSNGNARSTGSIKADNSVEVHVHWFRLLVGNCRTISDGLIVDLLGEPSIVALSRMQRMLPLSVVFPPAYSIFAFLIWWPFILNTSLTSREDMHQLYDSLAMAIGDAIKHVPFRDVCLRDSQSFYDLVNADATDAEFAAMLEPNASDLRLKFNAFVPLRARLFLNAIIDCKMPPIFTQDDGNRVSGHGESRVRGGENEMKHLDKIVHVLDTLQPAKFHWQWIELRLLLNEQALVEKLEGHDFSLSEAMRCSLRLPDKDAASDNENNFIQIILTRLLVRPDAAALFSEVVHLFGRSLEDSMLLQAKWFLGGLDVLFGRKSIRQRLVIMSESKGLSTKAQFSKPWGWSNSGFELAANRGEKKMIEVTSLEEGEVVEDGMDLKKVGKGPTNIAVTRGLKLTRQHVTERAFIELLFPCIDQSSDDSRSIFSSDLIKQLNNIEQQMSAVTYGASKQAGPASSGLEAPPIKGSNRKGIKGSTPGLARRQTGATTDPAPPSPAALRASTSVRLQLLLRLLPTICADREPSGRNLRHLLASVILRILGNRVVHEEADICFYPSQTSSSKRELELPTEASSTSADLSGESLFDRLLLVLHALLSSSRPSWMKLKPPSNSESTKEFYVFDREAAEILQNDLDRMQLPDKIRWRIQAAMPVLVPSPRFSVSCQPPSLSVSALASLEPSIKSGVNSGDINPLQRNIIPLVRTIPNLQGKSRSLQQDSDLEVDPWILLEDGAGSGPSSSNTSAIGSAEHGNLRASSWLKGTVRVRRTDLTYIGAVDDDS